MKFELRWTNRMIMTVKPNLSVPDMGYLVCGIFEMWNVGNVESSGCGMFRIWVVWHVRCFGCGIFGMWDVRGVGCVV